MKILNLLTVTLLLSTISFGQLEVTNDIIETPHLRVKHQSMNKTTSCSVDTVQYVMNKSTSLSSINVNNSTSAYAVGQYFDAPQPLELSGVDFYAYKADATNGTSIGVKVKVYNASPIDSLPMGSALLTTTVGVDTSFGGGALDVLRKSANFSSPLTLTDPFIIVIENNSAIELSAIMNDYQVGDGGQEWLAPVNISGTWLNAYDVNVGGLPFDADMLIEPYISYDLTASFTNDAGCLTSAQTVNFTNTSSAVLQNRMYNLAETAGMPEVSFTYDYGDGSAKENVINPSHSYASGGSYSVTLTDTLVGWTRNCSTDTTIVIGAALNPDYSVVDNALEQSFTDLSTTSNTITDWAWDFGDGNSSTQQNPTHNYGVEGNYTVCLTVTDGCDSDSTCQVIEATCDLVPGFNTTQNYMDVGFSDISTTNDTITSWSWDFGDGNTSTQQNPSHTYTTEGAYNVCLTITTDACGNDSTCQEIIVSTSGIAENNKEDIKIYPNPMNEVLNFTFENIPSQIIFVTVTGQEVAQFSPLSKKSSIKVSDWANGVYFAQFKFKDGSVVTKKVIKN